MSWDRVLTINDYYDGPHLGIAEVHGVPHVYESEFDHSTYEYGDTYFVSPIDDSLLSLVLEDWDIWLRWHAAHSRDLAELDTHPALPEDRARCEEIKSLIGTRLRADPIDRKKLRAKFRNVRAGGSWRGTEVEWSIDA